MPSPLDPETAPAIDAAQRHHVLTWEVLEEGDDLGEWLRQSFLADGRTALPDGAYCMISKSKPLFMKVPTEAEVKELFEDEEDLQKFRGGEELLLRPGGCLRRGIRRTL